MHGGRESITLPASERCALIGKKRNQRGEASGEPAPGFKGNLFSRQCDDIVYVKGSELSRDRNGAAPSPDRPPFTLVEAVLTDIYKISSLSGEKPHQIESQGSMAEGRYSLHPFS